MKNFVVSKKIINFATKLQRLSEMSKFLTLKNHLDNNSFLLHSSLDKDCITPDEKKRLYDFMEKQGLPTNSAYRRFFDKGFDQWELEGIDYLKVLYLQQTVPGATDDMNKKEREAYKQEHIGDKGYLAVLALEDGVKIKAKGGYYAFLKKCVLVTQFREWMLERGMSSRTCQLRFTADDFKPWEQKGIRTLFREWCDKEHEALG